jgi:hypothetical protein
MKGPLMPLNSKLFLDFDADYTSPLDLSTSENALSFTRQINLATGTGAGQADKIWHDERTLTASSTEDLDLAGVLVDAFGATVTFARIKGLVIYASPANTNNVVVGNVTNGIVGWFGAATHSIAVRPGGLLAIFAPDATAYAVTPGTADLLHVANSAGGTSVIYDAVIIGASV